jgi:hypothetical protein
LNTRATDQINLITTYYKPTRGKKPSVINYPSPHPSFPRTNPSNRNCPRQRMQGSKAHDANLPTSTPPVKGTPTFFALSGFGFRMSAALFYMNFGLNYHADRQFTSGVKGFLRALLTRVAKKQQPLSYGAHPIRDGRKIM